MKKKVIIISTIVFALLIIGIIIFRNITFGYDIKHIIYDINNGNQTVELGVPKLSFIPKENDKSYSYKNIRGNKILKKEVKDFLNTLSLLECNNTTYYYDNKNDFTIIDYSVKNHFIYNTISYRVIDGNYCITKKMKDYGEKLGGLKRYHLLNEGKISLYEDWDSKFEVLFLDGSNNPNEKYEFKATLKVILYKRLTDKSFNSITLEESYGDYEIKDNKLYYYRKETKESSNDITIPETSVFLIENQKLILVDNYLSEYEDNIILK